MTPNVVDIVQGALGPEVLTAAGERLGEDPNALGRAVGAAVPAVLWRLIERGRGPDGAEALLGAMRRTGAARALGDPLGRLQADARPDADLLGEDFSGELARFARIGGDSAAALLAMITPLGLGGLARIAPTPLNPDTLGRTLREQQNNVERAFPPGFDLRGAEPVALGAAPAPETATPTPAAPAAAPMVVTTPFLEPVADTAPQQPIPILQPGAASAPASSGGGGLPKWLLPLLAALILLGVAFALLRGLTSRESPEPVPAASATSTPERGQGP